MFPGGSQDSHSLHKEEGSTDIKRNRGRDLTTGAANTALCLCSEKLPALLKAFLFLDFFRRTRSLRFQKFLDRILPLQSTLALAASKWASRICKSKNLD